MTFALVAAWRRALTAEASFVFTIRSFVAGHSFSPCCAAKCRLPSIGVGLTWPQTEQATSVLPTMRVKLSWGAFSWTMGVPFHDAELCATHDTGLNKMNSRIAHIQTGLLRRHWSRSRTRPGRAAVAYARAARADSSRTPMRRRHLNRLKSQRGQRLGAVSCLAR